MTYDYHIIVIGAGSAGLVVASGAAGLGAKVALIEGEKMGGDCLNTGCVPSKSFLRGAHLADAINHAKDFGVNGVLESIDMEKVMAHVHSVIKAIEPHDSKERYVGLGVDVFNGFGTFVDKHTVQVNGRKITGKTIVIATGSNPAVPPIKGLDQADYHTNKTIFNISRQPKSLIVLGAGPVGSELGQGFAHLGTEVTMVDMAKSLFNRDDEEVGPLMLQRFILDGIALELGAVIKEVRKTGTGVEVDIERKGELKTLEAESILLALGRRPNTKNLGLENIGLETLKSGHVPTNDRLQTEISNIYAAGDVVGPFAYTHMAGYHAGIVIQNAIFPFKRKLNYSKVPWVTYTKPEVAHVGLTEAMAKEKGIGYKKHIANMSESDRARAEADTDGFLKILTNEKGVVIGATMVSEKAGEQIGLANMAINRKLKINAFWRMTFPYPTELDIYQRIALKEIREGFSPWKKSLVKKLFLRG